ncbi:putative uncharacterized protein DDB_G0277255 [Tripterygium wilfordii]|uniref:putative uncharacterized protein DDB_G0277255 n=1 Tax=Tripterygium wilfordii TaxID=458696 RepID=UPI0018F83C58|nr:putative uncharacterized protein DDB_G0277255 [Tripterygium wilfordii]
MENKTQLSSSSSSTTTSSSLDHLFGPKDSTSSSSSGIFSTIFPPPPTVLGRDSSQSGTRKHGNKKYDGQGSKGESSGKDLYQDETVEPCNLSSSIYYGGQENYSPRTKINNPDHDHSHHNNLFKKDGKDDDPNNGSNSNTASRGNWWQGSLYY